MIFKRTAAVLACLIPVLPCAGADPDAGRLLEGARMATTLVHLEDGLRGHLRHDGRKTPITLFLKGQDIQFQFSEKGGPWRIFHMRIGDEAFNLFEIADGKTRAFPPNKIVEPIADTDLTYEDLALRFLHWPNPKIEGREDVGGQPCWKLRIDKPRGQSGRYDVVYVWVHEKFGAFMRVRGHDAKGRLLKEFQVEDIMRVDDDTWTLRKMQVATHDPQNGRRSSITDVAFDAPKKPGPRGLR